jgi:hypothetical protein
VFRTSLRTSRIGTAFGSAVTGGLERLHCSALKARTSSPVLALVREKQAGPLGCHVPSILENCIEKNFHVPNMKSGLRPDSVRVQMQFRTTVID